jgi:hypothetical protein
VRLSEDFKLFKEAVPDCRPECLKKCYCKAYAQAVFVLITPVVEGKSVLLFFTQASLLSVSGIFFGVRFWNLQVSAVTASSRACTLSAVSRARLYLRPRPRCRTEERAAAELCLLGTRLLLAPAVHGVYQRRHRHQTEENEPNPDPAQATDTRVPHVLGPTCLHQSAETCSADAPVCVFFFLISFFFRNVDCFARIKPHQEGEI